MKRIKNKKAFFDFEVIDTYEAGLKLLGSEVKSLRQGLARLKGNFVHEWKGDLWVEGLHISQYKYATHMAIEPLRKKKLLLKRDQIIKIVTALQQAGSSAVILEIYEKAPYIKATLGIVRGKKQFDKRQTIKMRDEERKIQRVMKNFVR